MWIGDSKVFTGVSALDFPVIEPPSAVEPSSVASAQPSKEKLRSVRGLLLNKAALIWHSAEAAEAFKPGNRAVYAKFSANYGRLQEQIRAIDRLLT